MVTRRRLILMPHVALVTALAAKFSQAQSLTAKDEWISDVLRTRASESPLQLARFRDPVWVLLKPISWKPSNAEQGRFSQVTVPRHFVTELASIPSVFCTLMPRDAEYAYPAIVHDYLYWNQDRPRSEADQIFKWSMEDLEVSKAKISAIFSAVNLFGQSAWDENTKLKAAGERRILKEPPTSARISWSEWRRDSARFE